MTWPKMCEEHTAPTREVIRQSTLLSRSEVTHRSTTWMKVCSSPLMSSLKTIPKPARSAMPPTAPSGASHCSSGDQDGHVVHGLHMPSRGSMDCCANVKRALHLQVACARAGVVLAVGMGRRGWARVRRCRNGRSATEPCRRLCFCARASRPRKLSYCCSAVYAHVALNATRDDSLNWARLEGESQAPMVIICCCVSSPL